jgi:large subunit ribosomal protein L18e
MFSESQSGAIWTLRKSLKKEKFPIWKVIIKELSRSRSNRREVNVGRLASVTANNDVVIVPGKILGSGNINHKLTIWSSSISVAAAKKIILAGGKLIPLEHLIQKYPTGKGVRIIG